LTAKCHRARDAQTAVKKQVMKIKNILTVEDRWRCPLRDKEHREKKKQVKADFRVKQIRQKRKDNQLEETNRIIGIHNVTSLWLRDQ
jgi:hypothetical protein